MGIDVTAPRLSWRPAASGRGRSQTAYRILVAGDEKLLAAGIGDLWDTGRVESDQSVHVEYAGLPLVSSRRCYWKVQVWDEAGSAGLWSEPAWWEMGLLSPDDWQARWIGAPAAEKVAELTAPPSPLFRKEFRLDQPVESARAYICGLGYYELRLNGRKVGERVLDPVFTRYDRRVLYTTYDIAGYVREGANAVGVMLGNGWYNQHAQDVWHFETAPWRDRPKLLLQMRFLYKDGSELVLAGDTSWETATGPLVFDGIHNGEIYDARLERPGWDLPGYEAAGWTAAQPAAGPGGILAAQGGPPVKVARTVVPVSVNEIKPGVYLYDLGENVTGWAALSAAGSAGSRITLRYAEKLGVDGDIDQSNIDKYIKSGAFQTDTYILKGHGVETWEPRFTYHGFQYVRLTDFPGRPTLENLRGRVVHTAFAPAGEFACDRDQFNRIQDCTVRSYLGNFVGIPTDCPHREKNGWTGDAHLAAEQSLFNFASAAAYTKWMDGFADEQRPSGQLPGIVPTSGWGYNWGSGPAWDSAFILIPWYLFLYRGDTRILGAHYRGMRRYVDFLTATSREGIVSFGLGDWCPPGGNAEAHASPTALTSTSYYYADCRLLARIAAVLGLAEDSRRYEDLAASIKDAFNRAFYDPATGRYADGGQTSQACALYQGLTEPDERAKVLARLVEAVREKDYHPDFGILGAKFVLNALVENGGADTAYGLAAQTTYPSWGHWVAQGATTLWETWEGHESRNHIMFGDIGAWFYKTLAGINPDPERPGFKRVLIRPWPLGGLVWVRAWHDSPYGRIESAWRREGGFFRLDLGIPANATAMVYLPARDPGAVIESGASATRAEGVTFLRAEGGETVWALGSGEYRFVMPWTTSSPADEHARP